MSKQSHTNRGKWSEPGVPHRGWTCVGVEDLGEPSQQCQMCESIEIRYAHAMRHPEYDEILEVGCICAEHMEEDYAKPKQREKKLKTKTRRRATWKNREWRTSANGNAYINTEGFNLTVFDSRPRKGTGGWQVRVTQQKTGKTEWGKKHYSTQDKAKMAALYALLWAKEKM